MCVGCQPSSEDSFRAVNGITEVVPGAVRYKFDESGIRAFGRRAHGVEHIADTMNDLKIGAFRVSADVVGLSRFARFKHTLNGGA